jgi:hypothetical protein
VTACAGYLGRVARELVDEFGGGEWEWQSRGCALHFGLHGSRVSGIAFAVTMRRSLQTHIVRRESILVAMNVERARGSLLRRAHDSLVVSIVEDVCLSGE